MKVKTILSLFVAVAMAGSIQAQGFGGLIQRAAASAGNTATEKVQANSGHSNTSTTPQTQAAKPVGNAKIYYVSKNGSSRGADGLTPATAKKDIQAVLNIIKENGDNGAVVRVGEGNFLGYTNQGYIEIYNFITLEGGWNEDFTQRDPLKYITRIQPGEEQRGTNGSKGMIQTSRDLDAVTSKTPQGTLIIDGIMLDMGLENFYMPNNPNDERNGCPSAAFETGRMQDATPPQIQHQCFHSDGWIAGNVIIRNCLVANSTYFGLQFGSRCGEVEIYNCVIISNRYGGVRIDGGDKDGKASHVNFHHNTVAFSWCRDKYMEDMGYGYEFMNKINGDVHHNIFIGNNYAAVARTRVDTKEFEAIKKTNLYDNYFFLNAADLQLPSKGGGKWTNIKCSDIEDMVDEQTLPKAENNKELPGDAPVLKAMDQDYLQAFANLKVISESQNFNPNSASNQFRQAMGMNMQGSETRRVSMYGNRYNFDKAMQLFGAMPGYGAQKP